MSEIYKNEKNEKNSIYPKNVISKKMPRNARILISFKELEWLEKNEKMKKTTSTKKM